LFCRVSKIGIAIRSHWHIENSLHYTRDITFQEVQSRIRCNPGIFARMRSFGYNSLRRNLTITFSQDRYAAALADSMRYPTGASAERVEQPCTHLEGAVTNYTVQYEVIGATVWITAGSVVLLPITALATSDRPLPTILCCLRYIRQGLTHYPALSLEPPLQWRVLCPARSPRSKPACPLLPLLFSHG
jgi:hypothetical protein